MSKILGEAKFVFRFSEVVWATKEHLISISFSPVPYVQCHLAQSSGVSASKLVNPNWRLQRLAFRLLASVPTSKEVLMNRIYSTRVLEYSYEKSCAPGILYGLHKSLAPRASARRALAEPDQ